MYCQKLVLLNTLVLLPRLVHDMGAQCIALSLTRSTHEYVTVARGNDGAIWA